MSTALQTEDLAFESLYRLHRPPVYAYALATMRHSADAEDVTQTTFLNAYCALHRGVAPRDDLQWLLAIARNVCRDRFREAKRRPKEEPLNDWTVLTQREQPEFTVSEICREISELSPRYRQILLLREFEGRSYAEISAKLGVTEPAVQTLLTRARRALRDELELGMTCSQARRVSLRHLNGVALRDERRALQRHLRRCADCATFVGRTPRTPVARMLWLVWLPYRRIMTIIAGTSAPASPTAGAGAIAAKLLTIAVVGGAAAGVTVREVADAPTVGHVKRQPAGPVSLPPSRHATKPLASTAVTTTWATHNVASGREALTPTSRRATHRLPQLSSSTDVPTLAPTTPVAPHVVSVTPAESTPPTTPAATEAVASQATAPPQESPAPAGSGATVVDATPASSTGGTPGADSSGTPPVDATSAATGATPPTAAANATVPDGTPSTNVPPVTPGTTPPSTTPPTTRGNGNDNGNANDNGNGIAVGQNGTPPGQANKPDAPAHGRP